MTNRCGWAQGGTLPHDAMTAYHDQEWGVPVSDDRTLFEFLTLEGAQAGLSWATILNRRENYRRALDNFQPELIAQYGDEKAAELLQDAGIIRNRLKIRSVIRNAQAFLKIQREFGSFANYLWAFVDGAPIQNHAQQMSDIPVKTPLAEKLSKDLIKRGFTFVGPTICYAFMQAVGLVNDHTADCFRYAELGGK
ncbi:MAG: DNA-3-methyladenine glycosylase I [Anaerolineaceae bacterium]